MIMLIFLISTLILLALLDKALRVGRLETVLLKTRFKLFALRDELRETAIKGETEENQWFEYLDTTITKAIDELASVSLWEAFVLILMNRHNKTIAEAQIKLFEALAQEENQKLAEIYRKFVWCLGTFLFDRHLAVRLTVFAGLYTLESVKKERDRLVKTITTSPQTSTLLKYC